MSYHTEFKQYYSLGGTTKFTKHMRTVGKKSCKCSHNNNIYKKWSIMLLLSIAPRSQACRGRWELTICTVVGGTFKFIVAPTSQINRFRNPIRTIENFRAAHGHETTNDPPLAAFPSSRTTM